mgnify:CR=1 FL=1
MSPRRNSSRGSGGMKNGNLGITIIGLLAAMNLALLGFLYAGVNQSLNTMQATQQEILQRVTRVETTYHLMLQRLDAIERKP